MLQSAKGIRRQYLAGLQPRASRAPMWIALGAAALIGLGSLAITSAPTGSVLPSITHKRGIGAYDGAARWLGIDASDARAVIEGAEAGDRDDLDRLARQCAVMDYLYMEALGRPSATEADFVDLGAKYRASEEYAAMVEEYKRRLRVDVTWLLAR